MLYVCICLVLLSSLHLQPHRLSLSRFRHRCAPASLFFFFFSLYHRIPMGCADAYAHTAHTHKINDLTKSCRSSNRKQNQTKTIQKRKETAEKNTPSTGISVNLLQNSLIQKMHTIDMIFICSSDAHTHTIRKSININFSNNSIRLSLCLF